MSRLTTFERICLRLCTPFLNSLRGRLVFELPDGSLRAFGSPNPNRTARVSLSNGGFFSRVVLHGGVGLGESFVDGDWKSTDLPEVITILLEGLQHGSERSLHRFRPTRWLGKLYHWLKRNSRVGSRKNIYAHYDLGNSLFSELLDPTMTYSSALYRNGAETLEDAQREKLREIARKAQIKPGDEVLEIGTGWGSFALIAAGEFGARVTTTTISREQYDVAVQRVADAGLRDRVTVVMQDYRDLRGSFDRIVSIEMMEAIGEQFLPTFFGACGKLLKPDGLMVVQVISMPDSWYDEYRERIDWIQKYIFPGSHLPSLGALVKAMAASTDLVVEQLENIPQHYAKTLATWREALHARREKLATLGYDERFHRMFDYYFAVCEAEFGSRQLNLYQIVFTHINNARLIQSDSQIYADKRGQTLACVGS